MTGPFETRDAPRYEAWTKAQLYALARTLDVAGRSRMTKARLIEALRSRSMTVRGRTAPPPEEAHATDPADARDPGDTRDERPSTSGQGERASPDYGPRRLTVPTRR